MAPAAATDPQDQVLQPAKPGTRVFGFPRVVNWTAVAARAGVLLVFVVLIGGPWLYLAHHYDHHRQLWAQVLAGWSLFLVSLGLGSLTHYVVTADIPGTALKAGDSISGATYSSLSADQRASVTHRSLFQSLYLGVDGRWSTSRVSVLIWTGAIAYALLALFIADRFGVTFGPHGVGFTDLPFDDKYLLLLGGPFAAAVLARGITGSQVASSRILKPDAGQHAADGTPAPGGGPLDVISADDGQTDLVDTQYFLFNLIALVVFGVLFIPHLSDGLPNLPNFLVALTSGSALTYIGNKAAQGTTPQIGTVVPSRIRAGDTVQMTGTNLLSFPKDKPEIEVDGQPVEVDSTVVVKYAGAGGQSIIQFTVPAGVTDGTNKVISILPTGASSPVTTTATIVAAVITAVAQQPVALAAGTPLTIMGSGFEATKDASADIKLGGLSVEPVEWQDTRIVAQLDPGLAARQQPPPSGYMPLILTNKDAAGTKFDASFLVQVA